VGLTFTLVRLTEELGRFGEYLADLGFGGGHMNRSISTSQHHRLTSTNSDGPHSPHGWRAVAISFEQPKIEYLWCWVGSATQARRLLASMIRRWLLLVRPDRFD
jgi:hypothetical protein